MNAFRLFVSVTSALTLASAAQAYPIHAGGPLDNCPEGSLLGDGCPQNPGGKFKAVTSPSLWGAYARTSGQTWAGGDHPWTWNAPGIDVGEGYYTPLAQLQDPATATLPAGCSYSSTGNPVGGPEIVCDNVANPTLAHLDLSKNGSCTWVKFGLGVTGVPALDDDNIDLGNGCVVLDAVVTGYLDAAAPTHLVVTSVLSGSVKNGDDIEGGNIDNDFVVSGSGGVGSYAISGGHSGKCKDGSDCVYGSGSPQTYYLGHTPSSIIYVTQGNTGITDFEVTNTKIDGHGSLFPMDIDFFSLGELYGTVHFKGDVFLHAPGKIGGVSAVGTMIVEQTYIQDMCYTASAPHCEAFVHIIPSNQTQVLNRFSYDVVLQGKDGLEYPGGTALIWLGPGNDITATIQQTTMDHVITVANCVPNSGPQGVNPGASACSGGGSNYNVTSASLAENQDGTYVNQRFDSNYTDKTGALYRTYMADHSDTRCTNAPVWTNNHDLVTGALFTTWDSNSIAGGGGC